MEASQPVIGVVLAGGASVRMGADKALLEIDGVPILERAVSAVRSATGGGRVLVVGRDLTIPNDLDVEAIPDERQGSGPLAGLLTGLHHAGGRRVLAVACDMPFLQPALLAHLTDLVEGHNAVVPIWEGEPQSLCAVYAGSAAGAAEDALRDGRRSMRGFLQSLGHVRWVEEDELRRFDSDGRSFVNVNTPEDMERAERLFRRVV